MKDGNVLVEQTDAVKSDKVIYEKLILAPGESALYQINYEFIYRNYPQDSDYDVQYKSKVEIQIVSVN